VKLDSTIQAQPHQIKEESMKEDLKPRIINHYESQIKYHERQVERCIIDLARISMLYSGQLRLFETPVSNYTRENG
jgi:hypothetical protein